MKCARVRGAQQSTAWSSTSESNTPGVHAGWGGSQLLQSLPLHMHHLHETIKKELSPLGCQSGPTLLGLVSSKRTSSLPLYMPEMCWFSSAACMSGGRRYWMEGLEDWRTCELGGARVCAHARVRVHAPGRVHACMHPHTNIATCAKPRWRQARGVAKSNKNQPKEPTGPTWHGRCGGSRRAGQGSGGSPPCQL